MELRYFLALAFVFVSVAECRKEVCCEDLGCFQTDGVYRHLPKPSCQDKIGVELALYTRGSDFQEPSLFSRYDDQVPSTFSANKRTVFVVHGYLNSRNTDYMIYIKNALLQKEDSNVILVGWKKGAMSPVYPNSAANTRVVGAEIAVTSKHLMSKVKLPRENLWCIGFSLGAHVCGFAGMGIKFGRITGLDPAGPWFDGRDEMARLNPNTADLVDVMHTDGNSLAIYYGLLTPLGHMDFYPNGGRDQPKCWTYLDKNETSMAGMDTGTFGDVSVSCSHMRAVKYFEHSVLHPSCFVARDRCSDVKKLPKSCTPCGGTCGVMGYEADKYSQHGVFYLETGSRSPFCRY